MERRRRVFQLPWRTARRIRADVDDELAFHIEMRVDELVARGMERDAARARAVREFGDVDDARRYIGAMDLATEAARQRSDLIGDLKQDLAYALRRLRTAPAFAAGVIATFALGVGATTAIFSVVNGVLLRPLPFPRSERIVQLFQLDAKGNRNSVSQPNFHDWAAGTHSFSALALAWSPWTATVVGAGEPLTANLIAVTRDFFAVFQVQPALGRPFASDETTFGGSRAVIVSDGFWRRHLDASASALGRRLTIAGDMYTVVGVMPPAMTYPGSNDLWLPIELFPPNTGRTSQGHRVLGRLRDGVSLEAARNELSTLSRRLKQQYGNETNMSDAQIVPLREQLVGRVRAPLLVLLAASGILLLIACANALNLLAARLAVRQTELAVRVALGATRGRLARQVVVESAVPVLIGAILGVAIAGGGVHSMLAISTLPRADEVHLDARVLGFALIVSSTVALALGLLATWHAARRDPRGALSATQRSVAGSGSAARLRRAMVLAQMALTVILLVGAGILGHSFLRLLRVDPGFATEHVVLIDAAPTIAEPSQRAAYYNSLIDRVRSLPGVTAAGAVSGLPLDGSCPDGTYLLPDYSGEVTSIAQWTSFPAARKAVANYCVVAGDYFGAMRIPLLRGRVFSASRDAGESPPVAVVSAAFAAHAWPGQNPVGKLVNFGNMDGDFRPFTVVGVVGDVHDESLAAAPTPTVYAFLPQRPVQGKRMSLAVETSGDPSSIIASTRSFVRSVRPDVVFRARTTERLVSASVADRRFTLLLIVSFGGTALLLATLGVYSVVSYLVAQRTAEIGVRVALGAQRADIIRLILGEGGRLAALGIVIGVGGSLLATRLLRGLLFAVSTSDPIAFAAVVVLLVVVALVASYIPAHRAARVDPMDIIRAS